MVAGVNRNDDVFLTRPGRDDGYDKSYPEESHEYVRKHQERFDRITLGLVKIMCDRGEHAVAQELAELIADPAIKDAAKIVIRGAAASLN